MACEAKYLGAIKTEPSPTRQRTNSQNYDLTKWQMNDRWPQGLDSDRNYDCIDAQLPASLELMMWTVDRHLVSQMAKVQWRQGQDFAGDYYISTCVYL